MTKKSIAKKPSTDATLSLDEGFGGLRWDSTEQDAMKMKNAKWGAHPDTPPGDRPSTVLFLNAPKIAGVAGVAFATFEKKRLRSIELRYPGTLASCRALARDADARRTQLVNDVAGTFGVALAPVNDNLGGARSAGPVTVRAHASTFVLHDYAGALRSQPGTPAPLVSVWMGPETKKRR